MNTDVIPLKKPLHLGYMNIIDSTERLQKWQACILAVEEFAEVVLMKRQYHALADQVLNNDDIIFPDVDGKHYAASGEHPINSNVVSMMIPRLFNMRNELFHADLSRSKTALESICGISVREHEDHLEVLIES